MMDRLTLLKMVSALSGTPHRHFSIFHSFSQSMRSKSAVRAQDTKGVEAASDDTTDPADNPDSTQLSEDAKQMIAALSSRDRDVLAHEAAHMSAGGSYIHGGASYTYQTGPDGKRYAIGGEVGIDMSAVPGNPRATIAKMMAIRAAALAPADPSPQDISVAAAAAEIEAQASAQLNQELTTNSSTTPYAQANRYTQKASSGGTFINAIA
jgi:hypothetical protein